MQINRNRVFRVGLALAAAAAIAMPAWALEAVLTYQGRNHWVAEADNAPLAKLMAEAARGVRHFVVTLPSQERRVSVERLEVLQRILAREAQGPVVLIEQEGTVGANKIRVISGKAPAL